VTTRFSRLPPNPATFFELYASFLYFFKLYSCLAGVKQMPGENERTARVRGPGPESTGFARVFRPISLGVQNNLAAATFINLFHVFASKINLYPSLSNFIMLFQRISLCTVRRLCDLRSNKKSRPHRKGSALV
jgi:hypothetical protein